MIETRKHTPRSFTHHQRTGNVDASEERCHYGQVEQRVVSLVSCAKQTLPEGFKIQAADNRCGLACFDFFQVSWLESDDHGPN